MTKTKAKTPRFNVAKWAKSTSRSANGKVCSLCSNPEVNEAINEIIRLRCARETDASAPQVIAMLREHFGVTCKAEMLRVCCGIHRNKPWSSHGA